MERASFIQDDIFTSRNPDKSLAAWGPYGICISVLFNIQNTETEPRWHGWLIPWVAGLSCLRSTGHVLAKVDSSRSPKHKEAVSDRWSEWRARPEEHWIFWEFIEQERNNVLKEFEFGFKIAPYAEPDEYEVDDEVEDKMQLFREAVYWWRRELRAIEAALK